MPTIDQSKLNSFGFCEIIKKKFRENATISYCFAVFHFDFTRKVSQFVTEENSSKWRGSLNVNKVSRILEQKINPDFKFMWLLWNYHWEKNRGTATISAYFAVYHFDFTKKFKIKKSICYLKKIRQNEGFSWM